MYQSCLLILFVQQSYHLYILSSVSALARDATSIQCKTHLQKNGQAQTLPAFERHVCNHHKSACSPKIMHTGQDKMETQAPLLARCSAVHPSRLANGCEFLAVLLAAQNRWFCSSTITADIYRHALSIHCTVCGRALPVLVQA